MPTPSELLLMSSTQYQDYNKQRITQERQLKKLAKEEIKRRREQKRQEELRRLSLQYPQFSYIAGKTKKQKLANIKKYVKAKRNIQKIKQERINKIKDNIKRIGKGFYGIARTVPSFKYSNAGRARMVGNLSKGKIPQNPLNAPSVYITPTTQDKKKVNNLFRI